jgi:hypothetical protein
MQGPFPLMRHFPVFLPLSPRAFFLPPILAAASIFFGCDRSADPPAGAAAIECSAEGQPLPQLETFQQLRACYEKLSYLPMKPYLPDDQSSQVIHLLAVLDRLSAANRATLRAVRAACPDAEPAAFDLGALSDNLGLFSRRVEYAGRREEGDRGTVSVQVAGRLPLERLEFVMQDGYWRYLPGEPPPDLAEMLSKVADALHTFARVLHGRQMSPDELREDYRLMVGSKLKAVQEHVLQARRPAAPARER